MGCSDSEEGRMELPVLLPKSLAENPLGLCSRFTTMLSRNFAFLGTIRTTNTRSGCFITGHSSINPTVLWHYSFRISLDQQFGRGGPRRLVSQAWRAATRQLLKTADKPVLQHNPIISPRNASDGERPPSRI